MDFQLSVPLSSRRTLERTTHPGILVWGEMSRGWSSGRPVHCLALQVTSVTQPLPDASLSSLEKLSLVLPFVPEQCQGCELLLSFSFPADNTQRKKILPQFLSCLCVCLSNILLEYSSLNPLANAGDKRDAGLMPGSGRSPGEGNGNPLQYSCLENLGYSPWSRKESEVTEGLTLLISLYQKQEKCSGKGLLLIGKFRLKLNKVGKTTKPFRYDLNQISYDYTLK